MESSPKKRQESQTHLLKKDSQLFVPLLVADDGGDSGSEVSYSETRHSANFDGNSSFNSK
jgi:hypothetical protein